MTKSLILAALIIGAVDGSAAEPAASGLSASDQAQAASEPALLVLERQIILKQKERTEGKIAPDAYREWETKFRTTLSGAIAGAPKTPENAAAVVRIQTMLGEGKSAEASLERSLEENPGNPSLLLTKGRLLHKRGNFQGAAENALLAWEKSGRRDKSAWALYQETKGRVAPSSAASKHSPTARNPVGTAVANTVSNDPSGLYTGTKAKTGPAVIPNVGPPEESVPAGNNRPIGLITLLWVAAGALMVAWGALPKETKDRYVNPTPLLRKANVAAHWNESVTPQQFLDHYKGRSLEEISHEADKGGETSVNAGGPADPFRYVKMPNDPVILIDMRHFLVVGRMGKNVAMGNAAGLGIEVRQAVGGLDSAFQSQDFISNYYGTKFFSAYDSAKPFDRQLNDFFENPDDFVKKAQK